MSPDDSPKLCWQGGTCVVVGDEHARVTEAARAAECRYVSPDDSPKLCWQGGTCVVVGDEHARVTEAAKAAERHLRCKVLRTSPFWSKEGFSQETYNEQV